MKKKIKSAKTFFTKRFNSKTFNERSELIPYLLQDQISQLEREKLRIKRRTAKSIKEINDHIKNIESSLVKFHIDGTDL